VYSHPLTGSQKDKWAKFNLIYSLKTDQEVYMDYDAVKAEIDAGERNRDDFLWQFLQWLLPFRQSK